MSTNAFETEIKQFDFSKAGIQEIKNLNNGVDWPVVYILSGNNEAYVGETQSAFDRMTQHISNPKRKKLTEISLMMSDAFNKSAILDIENMLITSMQADGKYKLQNENGGQSKLHNYYQRAAYQKCFEDIWDDLQKLNIVDHNLFEVQNSDIFKYSPFKMLTKEQYNVVEDLLNDFIESMESNVKTNIIVNGGAGTGKTLIAIYFLNVLENYFSIKMDSLDFDDEDESNYNLFHNADFIKKMSTYSNLKIGFVVSVPSFKETVKRVFRCIKALKNVNVISPSEAAKGDYDILLVDEAHRLKRRNKLTNYKAYDNINKLLNLPYNATELDWLKQKSKKMLILFYDREQTVKESDVLGDDFNFSNEQNIKMYYLTTQLRVKGGNDYINFVNNLFAEQASKYKLTDGYDFKVYDNCHQMFEDIKTKNKEFHGLCRMLAGLSFYWRKKSRDKNATQYNQDYDFMIDGYKYCWNDNFNDTNFIIDDKYLDTVGCIYTSQGHDLNYAGVIIGEDIKYNPLTNKIEYVIDKFNDKYSKSDSLENTIKNIINAYKVLLTRGAYGTYVYACDKNLRDYIKKLVEK